VLAHNLLAAFARRGAIRCSTALAETNTQCQWVAPSMRLVVSSEAITRAASNFRRIAAQAAVIASLARRKALAIAPSEMASPNNSAIIRDSRSKPT
jgi:hypothetical protein